MIILCLQKRPILPLALHASLSPKRGELKLSGNGKEASPVEVTVTPGSQFKVSASLRKATFKATGKLQRFLVQSTFGKGVFPIT